jgi:uncharacterized protein (DUF58 family)
MTRYRVVLLLLVITLAGAFASGRPLWWSIAGALGALIIAALVWSWLGVNWLRVARRTITRVAQVGQILEEQFTLTNLSAAPKLFVEVRDHSSLPAHRASRVIGWLPGHRFRGWRARTLCLQRGRFTLGPMTVRSGDPLGIYTRSRDIPTVSTILVYPPSFELRQFPQPMGYIPGGEALRRRALFVTTNAAGAREYTYGDSYNRIHWGLSAKRNKLIVKEFDLDPMSEIWVMIDLHRDAHVGRIENIDMTRDTALEVDLAYQLPPSTEEYAVSIAASVARHFVNQDRAVGFSCYPRGDHREFLAADRGERQLNKIMETLAVVHAEGAIPFDRAMRAEGAFFPRGATVVTISASPDIAWATAAQQLIRSGNRVVAIVVDGETFGGASPSTSIVSALAEAGAIVRLVRKGEPIAGAIERATVA